MIKILAFLLCFSSLYAGALDFDKAQRDYITVASTAALKIPGGLPMTITLWFNSDSLSTQNIFWKGKATTESVQVQFRTVASTSTFSLRGSKYRNLANNTAKLSKSNVVRQANNFACFVWNPANADSFKGLVYNNGILIDSIATYTGTMTLDTTNDSVFIATSNFPTTPTLFAFDGRLSDIRMYRRVLSATEIYSMYNQRGADGISDSLVLRISGNCGAVGTTATTVCDFSKQKNVGVCRNSVTVVRENIGLKTKRRR